MSGWGREIVEAPTWALLDGSVVVGDCLDVMRAMSACSVDAVVTDPPYGLEFMGQDWDAPWKAGERGDEAAFVTTGYSDSASRLPRPTFTGNPNTSCLNCGGSRRGRESVKGPKRCRCAAPRFPNIAAIQGREFQAWCERWAAEALRVLKPGGHLVAFGGTRTYHRLACAIEDAGFEIRDSLIWIYASGFPKAHNLDIHVAAADWCACPGEPVPCDHAERTEHDVRKAGGSLNGSEPSRTGGEGTVAYGEFKDRRTWESYGDEGGASRFFYCGKSSSAERNAGLAAFDAERPDRDDGRTDGRQWDIPDSKSRPRANVHPTVKPLDLMRWLVRLVTPPDGIVLDPFTGSGTTGCAALLEGLAFVGVEREAAYVTIAEARMAWWREHPEGMELTKRLTVEREHAERREAGQVSLFE